MSLKFIISLLSVALIFSVAFAASPTPSTTKSVQPPIPPVIDPNQQCKRRDGSNPIQKLCIAWVDNSQFGAFYSVSFTPKGSTYQTGLTTFDTYLDSRDLGGAAISLDAATAYTFTVVTHDYFGYASTPATITFTTSAADDKSDPSLDLTSVVCNPGVDDEGRTTIECSWVLPPSTARQPTSIKTRARCKGGSRASGSTLYKNRRILPRTFPGTTTDITLQIHRINSNCVVWIYAFYKEKTNGRDIFHRETHGRGHRFRFEISV
jgi:hypothetical protein